MDPQFYRNDSPNNPPSRQTQDLRREWDAATMRKLREPFNFRAIFGNIKWDSVVAKSLWELGGGTEQTDDIWHVVVDVKQDERLYTAVRTLMEYLADQASDSEKEPLAVHVTE